MPAYKIPKVEWAAKPNFEHTHTTHDLKLLIGMALSAQHRSAEQEVSPVNSKRESHLTEWEDILAYVKRLGLNPESVFPEKSQMLWEMLDDVKVASMLVRSGANLSTRKPKDATNSSFLHVLSSSSDPKMHQLALLMIKHGADVNNMDAKGNTPLHTAIKNGALSIVEAILKTYKKKIPDCVFKRYGGRVNFMAEVLRSPSAVHLLKLFAQYCNYFDYIQYCCSAISKYMSKNAPEDHVMMLLETLLQLTRYHCEREKIWQCAYKRSVEFVERLINCKTNDNKRLCDVQSLLRFDLMMKNPVVIVFLIGEGAEVNKSVCKDDPVFAVQIATQRHSAKIVRLLLRLGADVNATDKFGDTPFSCWYEDDIARLLIKQFARLHSMGQKINEKDLLRIQEKPKLQVLYDVCVEELEKLKTIKITDSLMAHCFVSKSSYELSLLMRNSEILNQLSRKLRQLKPKLFPNFKADMKNKFKLAMNMRQVVDFKERELEEIFNGIFPNMIVRLVAEYSVDIAHLEREYYVSCFQQKI